MGFQDLVNLAWAKATHVHLDDVDRTIDFGGRLGSLEEFAGFLAGN